MKKLILLIFALILTLFLIGYFLNINGKLIAPQFLGVSKTGLDEVVVQSLKGTKSTYAVSIKNMSDGKSYALNENKVFEPGSLYKLWVMGTVFEGIQKGEIKEDEILSQEIKVLNEKFGIDEEEAELTEGEITMSVSSALNQMITISHNYAALLLLEKVKNSEVKKFIKSLGFNQSDLGTPPKTTTSDIALFLEKLYKGEIVSKESSQKMIDLLKKQQLNDGLPKLLPKDMVIAHKTGELGWFKHDAGIVFSDKGDYIIVVFSESSSPEGAQERIAEVSKAVYGYFNK